MKKVIFIAACLFTASTAIKAQDASRKAQTEKVQGHEKLTPDQRAQKNVDNLNAIASLSEEQKTKVKELAMTRITKVDAIRAKYKGQAENKETSKNEIEVVRKEYRQSVKALLTPEQLEKVKAKNKEQKGTERKEGANSADGVIDSND